MDSCSLLLSASSGDDSRQEATLFKREYNYAGISNSTWDESSKREDILFQISTALNCQIALCLSHLTQLGHFAARVVLVVKQLKRPQSDARVPFHDLFVFILELGRLQPCSWFHTVENWIVLLTHEEVMGLNWEDLSGVLHNLFYFPLLLISIIFELPHLDFFCQIDVGDILEPFFFELLFDGSQDTQRDSGISDEFLDAALIVDVMWWWRWGSLGLEVLVYFLSKFFHLVAALANTLHEGRDDFHDSNYR